MRKIYLLCGIFAMAVLVSACRVPKSPYGPGTSNVGAAPEGQPSAVYEIPSQAGKGGQVRVWSDGVTTEVPRAFRVGLVIRNDASDPISVRPSEVRLVLDDMPELRPTETTLQSVAPGQSKEIILHYALPGRYEDSLPDAYSVAWEVSFGAERYKQVTPFTRQTEGGFVPNVIDSSQPADRRYIEGQSAPAPIGIPFGGDPDKR